MLLEIGVVVVQADYFAEPPESEQRCASVHAVLAVGGVPLGQLGPPWCWTASIGGAGFSPLVSEFKSPKTIRMCVEATKLMAAEYLIPGGSLTGATCVRGTLTSGRPTH
jgi:hypothetical protein